MLPRSTQQNQFELIQIRGLLFAQGVSGYEPLRKRRRERLEDLRTGDGGPLPAPFAFSGPFWLAENMRQQAKVKRLPRIKHSLAFLQRGPLLFRSSGARGHKLAHGLKL